MVLIQYKDAIGNPIVEIRWWSDHLIATMGFPILVRWYLYIEWVLLHCLCNLSPVDTCLLLIHVSNPIYLHQTNTFVAHEDVMTCKYWPFVWGVHWTLVDYPQKRIVMQSNNQWIPLTKGENQGVFNTLRPQQNGRHFADDTFNRISVNDNVRITIGISLKFVPKGPINNIPALVQIMAWRRAGDKPLSEPMMVSLLTHLCVTRPQWVKQEPIDIAVKNLWTVSWKLMCSTNDKLPLGDKYWCTITLLSTFTGLRVITRMESSQI